jgi:hypothetical protein
MKQNNDGCGTSFHVSEIVTTVNKLKKVLGEPYYEENTGEEKVNFDWRMEHDGIVFTIYDWKQYRPLDLDEEISFHIGGYSKESTEIIKLTLERLLNEDLSSIRQSQST